MYIPPKADGKLEGPSVHDSTPECVCASVWVRVCMCMCAMFLLCSEPQGLCFLWAFAWSSDEGFYRFRVLYPIVGFS